LHNVAALAFALHISPDQVRAMSLDDFFACLAFMSTLPEDRHK